MKVTVIDLGINNLSSVIKSIKGFTTTTDTLSIASQANEVECPDLIVLPGLGKFSSGMFELSNRGLIPIIQELVAQGSKLVGICLGMQLLGNSSEESEGISGLGLIPGVSSKFKSEANERIPNIGWREVSGVKTEKVFRSLNQDLDFYFVHSYHFTPIDSGDSLAISGYGNSNFVSAVKRNNICGFQFHPEKSGRSGELLVKEVLDWARNEN